MTIESKVVSVNQFECGGIAKGKFSVFDSDKAPTAIITTYEDGKKEVLCLAKDRMNCVERKNLCNYLHLEKEEEISKLKQCPYCTD